MTYAPSGCGSSTCSCVVTGTGCLKVTGSGSSEDPYVLDGGDCALPDPTCLLCGNVVLLPTVLYLG